MPLALCSAIMCWAITKESRTITIQELFMHNPFYFSNVTYFRVKLQCWVGLDFFRWELIGWMFPHQLLLKHLKDFSVLPISLWAAVILNRCFWFLATEASSADSTERSSSPLLQFCEIKLTAQSSFAKHSIHLVGILMHFQLNAFSKNINYTQRCEQCRLLESVHTW